MSRMYILTNLLTNNKLKPNKTFSLNFYLNVRIIFGSHSSCVITSTFRNQVGKQIVLKQKPSSVKTKNHSHHNCPNSIRCGPFTLILLKFE